MANVRVLAVTMSLDGWMAGPDQGLEHPLGVDGERLHEWAFATRSIRRFHGMDGGDEGIDDTWAERSFANVGATIMGRNMFGPVRGPWPAEPWNGWWGEDPPFHHPVFVLTHHPRESIEMQGGTTFHFVSDGIDSALDRAITTAGDRDVRIGGGAATIRQYLRAGLLDEFHLVIAPILLGAGERIFDEADPTLPDRYECVEYVPSGRVAHLRIVRRS